MLRKALFGQKPLPRVCFNIFHKRHRFSNDFEPKEAPVLKSTNHKVEEQETRGLGKGGWNGASKKDKVCTTRFNVVGQNSKETALALASKAGRRAGEPGSGKQANGQPPFGVVWWRVGKARY